MLLPALREELTLHPGTQHTDGSPSWLIYDPHRMRYFRIGWVMFEILRRWKSRDATIVLAEVNETTTLNLDEEDIKAALTFLHSHELLRPNSERDTKQLLARWTATRQTTLQWLIHNYLFFRIPLLKPDAFLSATLPRVRFLAGKSFALLTLVLLAIGVILVVRDWSNVVVQLKATMTVEGLIGYGFAIAFAKLIHELGHAYVAKAHGCRVATMGLAFLVLYPIPYTDTNDAWKVRSRRGRLAIATAGMAAELYIAAWATFLWSFLPDGPAKSAAMTLAVTTWVMSLAVNTSPIMRFDGYYILSDLWEMPNLHGRSFALGRWFMREVLFSLGDPPPEPLPRTKRNLLIAFAYAVWIYRLVIFLGIALLVYHFFIKLVGIVLFCIEIGWFVALPMAREFSQWWKRRDAILRNPRSWMTVSGIVLLVLVVAVPWFGHAEAPALLRSERISQIYPVVGADVVEVFVSEGETKRSGEPLFKLRSATLEYQIEDNRTRTELLQKQIRMAGFDDDLRAQSQFLREKLASALTERQSLLEQQSRLDIIAPFDGQVFDLTPDLRVGQSVGHRQKLASIRELQQTVAIGCVGEQNLHRIEVGQQARFYPETATRSPVRMQITLIETHAVRSLEYPALASRFGGPIASLDKDKGLQPQSAVYKVVARPIDDVKALDLELRGTLQIKGRTESLVMKLTRAALAVLVRESGM